MARQLTEELMDRPDLPVADAERALADIERVHRFTGIGALRRACAGRLPERGGRLLDLGTGTGYVPARLTRRRAHAVVVGIDRKLAHLLAGRRRGIPQLRVVADATALPFRPRSFDGALSTLFFHHFDEATNERIVREMRRVSRHCVVVVDLRRTRWGRLLARLVLTALRLGPVAAYDGRLSVDQAWTLDEVRALIDGADILELRRRWPFRFSLVVRPAATGS